VDIFTNKKETEITLTVTPPQKQQIACLHGETGSGVYICTSKLANFG